MVFDQTESIVLNKILNINHRKLFKNKAELLLVYGGTCAGKSYSIADKLLLNAIFQNDRKIKILCVRKTLPSLRASVIDILIKRAAAIKLNFKLNRNTWTAVCDNLEFIFLSTNNKEDKEKIKSITDVDFIWINEVSQIRQEDFEEIYRRLRGGESEYCQCLMDFNPIGKFSWVYKEFFEKKHYKCEFLKYTIDDNHPEFLKLEKTKKFIERLEALKTTNYNAYKIYRLGEWGDVKGVIFTWDVVPLPSEIKFDEIIYGLDFGYSVDPAALVKIYRKADEYWVQELLYETGLTNQQLARKMKNLGVTVFDDCYADCAEPKSIDELREYPFNFNVKPCVKGHDSVRAMIDYLLNLHGKIHIVDGSENIIREMNTYVWKEDKDGNKLNEPIKFNDHAMKAIQYAIYTHNKNNYLPGFAVV